jgi:uncharacterized protein (TIGR02246 family)
MTTTGPTDADKAAVATLTQRVIAAWAYQDADSFANVFTEDATMVLPAVYVKGREEIRLYMKDSFENKYKDTQVTGKPLDIRFLGSEVAILLSQGGVTAKGESAVSDDQSVRASWLCHKVDGKWWLAAYMNSPAKTPLPVPGT